MAVSHFVKIDAAVDDVAVVRQIGEVIYSNQSTAVAAVCGVITEGFGSSLTADVIGRVAEDGTGLNVVKALKIHRGLQVSAIRMQLCGSNVVTVPETAGWLQGRTP